MTSKQLYKLRHPDRVKASKEKWRKANMDKHAAHSKAWRDRNPDKAKEVDKTYNAKHKDKVYLKTKKRRALKRNAIHIPYNRMDIYYKYDGVCQLCFENIDLLQPPRHTLSLSLDHIIPLSLGGHDADYNLVPAHYGCNSRKGNRI